MKGEIPKHIAIIMDGNGRWASKRKIPRLFGHRAGAKTVDIITEACAEIGVQALTLYSFSTENWIRPKDEVDGLMHLLEEYLIKKINKLCDNDIKLNTIGDTNELPDYVKKQLNSVIDKTKNNKRMILTLALNYGSRQEILTATKRVAKDFQESRINIDTIDEKIFTTYLETHDLPDVDFMIRTSGEYRISNFLLWQLSYAELYITKTLWPDFRKKHLTQAIEEYQKRSRRFGGVAESCS